MANPLRFGIVGCGVIAPTHGNVLRKLKEEGLAELVAVADIDLPKAEAFAAKHGVKAYASLEELLGDSNVEAVTICTPSGLHGKMAVQIAQAGRHVLSEKPLDVWLDAVDAAIEATSAAGVTYGGIFQERFAPDTMRLKRAIAGGALGDLVLACAETKWYRSQAYYDSGEWRGTWELDAGVFSNQGIHSLDKVQWLAGEVVEVMSASLYPGKGRTIEAETLGVVTVRYASGAVGTLTMTTLSYPGFPERVDVGGTKGSGMLVGDHLAHFTTLEPWDDVAVEGKGETPEDAAAKASDPAAVGTDCHLANVRDFVLAIREGREPLVSATEARRAVKLLNDIYRAAGVVEG